MTQSLTLAFLGAIILAAFGIAVVAARRSTTTNGFYVAEHGVAAWQNGMAIAGDFLSAAAFLGILGATALTGLSGFYIAISVPTTFVLVALIVAEPLRNLGKFTLSDMLAARFPGRGVRAIAALNALVVSGLFMVAQFVGAGLLIKLLLGLSYPVSVVLVGVLMTAYVLLGGMVAVTWIQVFKTGLLLFAAAILFTLTMARFNWSVGEIFAQAVDKIGPRMVTPPHAPTLAGRLDYISLNLGVAIGPLGLPHVLVRFLTVPNAQAARRSVVVASWIISLFLLSVAFIGLGAAVLLGPDAIRAANPAGTLTTPMLAQLVGGPVLLAFVSAVIFATILAVIAGVAISAAGTFAHDIYANILRPRSGDRERLFAARSAAVLVSGLAILLSLGASHLNLAYIGIIAFTVAASANVPAILLTLFWRGFNETGALACLWVGLLSAVGLVLAGPTILGADALFPLANVGIASVPAGFLAAWLGSLRGARRAAQDTDFDTLLVRASLTS